jgi:hypothetical protein
VDLEDLEDRVDLEGLENLEDQQVQQVQQDLNFPLDLLLFVQVDPLVLLVQVDLLL